MTENGNERPVQLKVKDVPSRKCMGWTISRHNFGYDARNKDGRHRAEDCLEPFFGH